MATFLVVAGLTGTIIAFEQELDAALLPGWFEVHPQGEALSPFDLAAIAERLEPRAQVAHLPLDRGPTQSARLFLAPKVDPATGELFPHDALKYDEVFLDPYTGRLLGARLIDEVGFARANLVSTAYVLHYSLLLGDWGSLAFGVVALVWAINCLIGLYLTFPLRRRGFVQAWRRAWTVRSLRPAWRFSFEFHRAGSLWAWLLLLVFALSSMHFNLDEQAYAPLLGAFVPYRPVADRLAEVAASPAERTTDLRSARERGRELMQAHARRQGFTIAGESHLGWWPEYGAYVYAVRSPLDVRRQGGQTRVFFSGADGRELAFDYPSVAAGNAVTAWLSALHMAEVGGRPYQFFVSLFGLAVAALSITGVVVWLRRRLPARTAR